MPDQVRHDDSTTIYDTVKMGHSMFIIQDQTDPEVHPHVGPQFGAAERASDSEFTGGCTMGSAVFLDLK